MDKIYLTRLLQKALVLVVVFFLFSGCGLFEGGGAQKERGLEIGLKVADEIRLPDIPVPKGFRFLKKDSFTYERPAPKPLHFARHRYKGRPQVEKVVRFFRDEMPLSGWALKSDTENFGIRILEFTKARRACKVSITRQGWYTLIVVLVITEG